MVKNIDLVYVGAGWVVNVLCVDPESITFSIT